MPFGLTSRFTPKAIVVAVCGGDELVLGLGFGVTVVSALVLGCWRRGGRIRRCWSGSRTRGCRRRWIRAGIVSESGRLRNRTTHCDRNRITRPRK